MPWKRRVSKAEPLNQAETKCLRGASPSLTPTLDLERETDSKLCVSWAWISRHDLGWGVAGISTPISNGRQASRGISLEINL